MRSPVENLPVTIFPNASINEFNKQLEEMDRDRERIVVTHQVINKIRKSIDVILVTNPVDRWHFKKKIAPAIFPGIVIDPFGVPAVVKDISVPTDCVDH